MKIFSEEKSEKLEKEINSWLDSQNLNYQDLISVSITQSQASTLSINKTVAITYKSLM